MRLSRDRRGEVERVLEAAISWAESRSDVVGLALVGSWVRRQATMSSDVDLVVLVTDIEPYLQSADWWGFLGEVTPVRTKSWGNLIERRARLASGLEIDFGFVDPGWAGIDPVDYGTMAVVRDGMRVLHDPQGHIARLAHACAAG